MVTRLYTHDVCLEHRTGPGHPERPDRLRALAAALEHETFDALDRCQSAEAARDILLLAHTEAFVERVERTLPEESPENEGDDGIVPIGPETSLSAKSLEAVMQVIGGLTAGVDDVFAGRADTVFVAGRPPGHHAERDRAMGFCIFNHAAVAARHAQRVHGIDKVAIVDWDVHHGNGTQDIFRDDPSVLYCSTHQMPLFPGTGAKTETGAGNIVNAPLSAHDGSDHFREAFRSRVLPALSEARPDLIIISAGFDAHHRDPLGQLNLVADDFDWATGKVLDIAGRHCDNRVVSVLEGGYDLIGLAESAAVHILRLMKG